VIEVDPVIVAVHRNGNATVEVFDTANAAHRHCPDAKGSGRARRLKRVVLHRDLDPDGVDHAHVGVPVPVHG
jgi:hypothetical protein